MLKPSEVEIAPPVPFMNTFGRAEYEATVALLVMACEHNGDEFRALTPRQIGEALVAVHEREPWKSWSRNPFFRPNIRDLVDAGFAEFLGDAEKECPVRLTREALARLEKWKKPDAEKPSST